VIERLWRFLKKIVLYNEICMGGTMSVLPISKPRFSSFFANIKQYRPELQSLMTLKFHTLEHIGVCGLLRRNLVMLLFRGAKIALAQQFSLIFSKNE
jgi:hypothetical protein